jgi:hypothetical protein
MRSFHARGSHCAGGLRVASALVLASLATTALAQDAGIPSLLPLPASQPAYPLYPVTQTAATDVLWADGEESPAPAPPVENLPSPDAAAGEHSVISPDYEDALYGDAGGEACGLGGSCGDGCPNFYTYGNVLWMTREKRGGFVTSIDSVTNNPRLFFCDPGFGGEWYGGFEVGGGWILGGCGCGHSGGCGDSCGSCCGGCCGTTALELVYWGLFPETSEQNPTDPLISLIDFSDLDYAGGPGATLDTLFSPAEMHRILYKYDFNSVEVQLVGNSMMGGPFGGARTMPSMGSRCGFGWLAGFRYIDYSEGFLFSADNDDTTFNNDPDEAHYQVSLDNDLIGFQVGSGFNFWWTQRISTYAIGKVGIYNNHVTQLQQIYGTAGPVTINNGPNTGAEFFVESSKDELAVVGQIDLGVRWAMNQRWAFDAGYRIVGMSGVAIAEDNVQRGNFQNLQGIADIQTQGMVLLHGGYAGVTYSF